MQPDPKHFKSVQEVGRPDILLCLAPLDGDEFAIGSFDFHVYRADLSAEKVELQPLGKHDSYVTGVVRHGQRVISGSYDRHLEWWDLDSASEIRRVAAHDRWMRNLAIAPDGRYVVSVADDMVGKIWDAESGQLIHELREHAEVTPHHFPSMLYACAVSPDGQFVATADRVGSILVWEADSGKLVARMEAPEMYTWDPKARRHSIGGIRSLAFSLDGKLLAAGGMGQVGNIDHLQGKTRIEIFDWREEERTHLYGDGQFKGLVEALAFHPEGHWLVAAGGDNAGFVGFYDYQNDAEKPLVEHKAPMHVHDLHLDAATGQLTLVGHGRVARFQVGEA